MRCRDRMVCIGGNNDMQNQRMITCTGEGLCHGVEGIMTCSGRGCGYVLVGDKGMQPLAIMTSSGVG